MEYKGYMAQVEYDAETDTFHGEVVNLRDVITFEGDCVEDLKQAFRDSVEDYLAFCKARGEEPERPFSGTFTVRIKPELHRDIALEARRARQSLNSWVTDALETAARRHASA